MIRENHFKPTSPPLACQTTDAVKLLMIVEGTNDIEFLRRISLLLHHHDQSLPNLAELEQQGRIVFLPFGGGHVGAWSERLAPLSRAEFHLYDRELPPETEQRRMAAKQVNRRGGCRAVLTRKRSLENYLHPQAIELAGDVTVDFDDFDNVSQIVARALYQHGPGQATWQLLSGRARSRMTNRTKRWLNTAAAEQMTINMLTERDSDAEIVSWLQAVREMIGEFDN